MRAFVDALEFAGALLLGGVAVVLVCGLISACALRVIDAVWPEDRGD